MYTEGRGGGGVGAEEAYFGRAKAALEIAALRAPSPAALDSPRFLSYSWRFREQKHSRARRQREKKKKQNKTKEKKKH